MHRQSPVTGERNSMILFVMLFGEFAAVRAKMIVKYSLCSHECNRLGGVLAELVSSAN